MNRLPSACAVVCLLAFVFGNLPSCIGSVEEVLTSSKENVTVDEVISHGQPLSEVTEKAATDMQSDQPLPDDPEFVCGDDSINVKINYNDVDNLSVLAPDGSPVSLSELPDYCKTFVTMLSGSIILVSRYDGCFVQRQGSAYALNLLWFGRYIQRLCTRDLPPVIVCKKTAMKVVFYGDNLEEKLSVKVNGRWLALRNAQDQCRFDLASFPEMMSLSAPFLGCGMTRENGAFILNIQSEKRDMLLSCPDSGMAEDWFDPQFSVAPQTPQSPQCNCPCSQKRPSEVQLPLETPTVGPPSQTTISKTPDIPKPPQVTQFLPQIRQGVQEFTQLLSPGWQKIIQQQKVPKLPPSVQRPTVDPPSQTISSEILPKPPQEPQFQSQMRQGVKEFSELLRPYLQNVQQVSRPKDPQMPKKPATSPPPTESPTSSIVPVDKSEPSSNQPTKGTDPPPAQRPSITPYLFALSPPGNPYALSWYHPFKQLGSLRATAPPVKKQQQQKVPDLKLPPTPQPSTTVPSKSPVALVWYPKPPVLPSFATTVPPVKTPAHTTRKLPVTSATAPKIQNVQTAYRPHQNAYPAVFILNPFLHPNPENWQSFMSGESLPFIVGPAPIWEPFQSPDLSSQYLGQGQSPSHGQKQH